MPLPPGARLGPYEVLSALGAGGMGEVYRARDTRLDRSVAIKVLPDTLAADPQFRDRFDREARAISQLTHPNICTLHDVGEHAGRAFLVMELLDGETLADHLTRAASKGPGVPVDAALRIAIQIADALAAAHRTGVVHRDLKPGNVMLTRSGAKLLDFGLAKVAAPAVMTATGESLDAMLPTTPPQAITARGTILGTFQYMAPEQLEGADADARTDVFAFGCVLFEVLTGRRPFEAATQASQIAAILEREPASVTALQPRVPPFVDVIVRKCLAKQPDQRWHSAADLASALRWAAEGVNASPPSIAAASSATPHAKGRGLWLLAAGAALAVFAAGVSFGSRYWTDEAPPVAPVRFEMLPPAGVMLSPSPVASAAQLALSHDGRQVAFVAATRGQPSQIWIRPFDGVQARPLAGTEGASFPFWSPDGRSIGFFAAGKLKKVDTNGGVPQALCDALAGRGGTWNTDGVIVFTGQANSPISRVAASGGLVTAVTTFAPDQAIFSQYWPQFLPDGRHFLYYQRSGKTEHQGIFVTALDSAQSTRILETDARALYADGHLLFVRDGILFAQAFDERTLRTGGEPVRLADGVAHWSSAFGYSAISAAMSGQLAYGPTILSTTSLRWHDRSGAALGPGTVPRAHTSPRLSPDQKVVLVAVTEQGAVGPDLWLLEPERGTSPSRVTSDPGSDWFPVWPAQGGPVFFGSARTGATTIFQKAGAAPEEVFADSVRTGSPANYPVDVSREGRFLLFQQSTPRGYDLGTIALSADRTRTPLLEGMSNEVQGRFSPNSRWVAYASDESGRFELYVRPFPADTTQPTIVSTAGGMQPEWRSDGKELFYLALDGTMMAVPVVTDGPAFTSRVPRGLFRVEVPETAAPYPTHYAVTADGQRFLVNGVVDQPTRPALTVILNWRGLLKR